MITLKNAFEVLPYVIKAAKQHDAHVALTGSVLYNGASTDDLDFIVYPNATFFTEEQIKGIIDKLGRVFPSAKPASEIELCLVTSFFIEDVPVDVIFCNKVFRKL